MKSKSKIQENERKFYLSEFSHFDGEYGITFDLYFEYGKFYENKILLDEFEEVD